MKNLFKKLSISLVSGFIFISGFSVINVYANVEESIVEDLTENVVPVETNEATITQQSINNDKKDHILYETDEYIVYDDYSIEGKTPDGLSINANGEMIMLAHMSSTNANVGQQVNSGTKVGVMGNTGISFGAHVHVERWNYTTTSLPACNNRVNPNEYLNVFNSGYTVTQWYNTNAGSYACGGYHKGTDIVPTGGDWSVNSPTRGIVRKVAYDDVFGYHVVIEIQNDMNIGNLDHLSVSDTQISTSGWSFDTSTTGQYRFVFVMDAVTGQELGRMRTSKIGRGDVCNVYGHATNCGNSGFSTDIPITDAMREKTIKIMVRYTDDISGNSPKSDYYFPNTIKVPAIPKRIVDGDVTFYLHDNWLINYAVKTNNGVREKIYYFYNGSKYDENRWSHLEYEFSLNANNEINWAKKFDDVSQQNSKIFYFYSGTQYDSDRWKHVQFEFDMGANNIINNAKKYADNTMVLTNVYEFYANTYFDSNRWSHVRYEYGVDANKNITWAKLFENTTQVNTRIYNFYTNTKYDQNKWNHVSYEYKMKADATIDWALRKNDISQETTNIYYFYANTKYDSNRWNHMKYDFRVTNENTISWAKLYEDNTKINTAIYTFYPDTKHDSDRWNHVEIAYKMDNDGNIISAQRKADNTQLVLKTYIFKPNTKYDSNRWSNVEREY